jgi:preprotein translocase subunit SecB
MADNEQKFEIQKIFVKDISFEAPNSPQVFRDKWKPKTEVHLATNARKLDDNMFEVILNITVTAKQDEEQVAFLVELKQAGIFLLQGFDENQLDHVIGSYCPQTLFPFAREAVSDFVTKGGFPPMLLTPVNFDALYAQQKERQSSMGNEQHQQH